MTPESASTGQERAAGAQLRIVIPAYNEGKRIAPVLRDYCSHFRGSAVILVVVNGSTDETADTVREAQCEFENLESLEIRGLVGKGTAVRAGFATGGEAFVGFTDADGSTTAAEFDRIYQALRLSDADGLIGSRWLPGSRIEYAQGLRRRIVSRVFNMLTRSLFGLRFADTQCGSKIFRRAALEPVIESLEHAGYAFDVELLWLLKRNGRRIVEFPIAWSDSHGSKINLIPTSIATLASVLRLRARNSPVSRIRFLSNMARKTCSPVRSGRKVLICGSAVSFAEFSETLRGRGFEPVAAQAELAAWWPECAALRDGWRLRAAFFAWYTFVSRREYDAIVEFEDSRPWFVAAFSAKPALLIRHQTARPAHLYRWFYRTTLSVDRETGQPERAAAAITLLDTQFHAAVFTLHNSVRTLCYRNAESGNLEQLILR